MALEAAFWKCWIVSSRNVQLLGVAGCCIGQNRKAVDSCRLGEGLIMRRTQSNSMRNACFRIPL